MAKAKPKPETVGNRIERARTNYRMSQAQLAAMLDVTRAAVSQYEQDKITPRKRVILRLAEVFRAAPEWFEHGRGERPEAADLPVAIPEIDLALITPQVSAAAVRALKAFRTGRHWTLPSSLLGAAVTANYDDLVALVAPNHVAPVNLGDRVVVDLQRRSSDTDPGVFLVYVGQTHSARLSRCQSRVAADILGRVVGVYRSI